MTLFRLIGLRHLGRKRARTFLTGLGVSFGVALYVAIRIINQSTLESFRERTAALAGPAALVVSGGESGFREDRLRLIEETPGVARAVPLVESRAHLVGPDAGILTVLGVDLLDGTALRSYGSGRPQVLSDPISFLSQPDSLLVTGTFARAHRLKLGSPLVLATPEGTGKFIVRGLLPESRAASALGGALALMDIDAARAAFGKNGRLDRVEVVTGAGESAEEVAGSLRQKLGGALSVEPPESQALNLERMVTSFQTMLSFFSFYALLVGLFLVANSIGISVTERTREIGTLRALGASRGAILLLIVSEATVLGTLGALAGSGFGKLLASALVGMVTSSLSVQTHTAIEVSRLGFGAGDVLRAVGIGMLVSVCAALWPALRAASIAPVDAMRPMEAAPESQRSPLFRRAFILGAVLLVYYGLSSRFSWGDRFAALGVLDQLAAMVGPALAGPALVLGLLRGLRGLVARAGGLSTRLAHDSLLRNDRRTASNVTSLIIGFALVMVIDVADMSFRTSVTAWFEKVCRGDLIVSSSGNLVSMDVQPLAESVGARIAKTPGVDTRFNGGLYGLRFVHVPYENRNVILKAVYEVDSEKQLPPFDVVDRPWEAAQEELFHGRAPAVFVSESFARHFGKNTGDSLRLSTPSGAVLFRVAGLVRDYSSFEGVIYLARDRYRILWQDRLVNAFVYYVLPGWDAHRVRDEIDRSFGGEGLKATPFSDLKSELAETIEESLRYLRAVEAAALAVGLLGLLNTLLMSVFERTRELGMLRAIGMSRRLVYGMILREALFQGVASSAVAVVLGAWVGQLWVSHTLTLLMGWVVQFDFPWFSAGSTLLLGAGVALAAGLWPGHRAAHLEIAGALQCD